MPALCAFAMLSAVLLAAGPEQSGYLTGAPVPDWLGLATVGGRDAIRLGDGCESAGPGMNVLILDAEHLQVLDPLAGPQVGTCQLATRTHMSDVPCARGPVGLCDVAFD